MGAIATDISQSQLIYLDRYLVIMQYLTESSSVLVANKVHGRVLILMSTVFDLVEGQSTKIIHAIKKKNNHSQLMWKGQDTIHDWNSVRYTKCL